MKIRIIHVAVAAAASLAVAGCSSERGGAPTSAPEAPRAASPTPKEAVAAAALVLDVRTKEEFEGGHLANAENIPVDDVEAKVGAIAERVGGDKSKPIAVYCGSGGRAGRAKSMLEKAGFTHVTNAGGYRDLKE